MFTHVHTHMLPLYNELICHAILKLKIKYYCLDIKYKKVLTRFMEMLIFLFLQGSEGGS